VSDVRERRIAVRGIRSLAWRGDTLVDWVDGGREITLDGEVHASHVRYAYPFDAAVASPSGAFAAIYELLGTKGLILRDGKIVREINRSYYQADAYEYPIALIRLENGREVIVHCPEDYNRLEIEDLATGERLTAATDRNPSDCFHARIAASRDGKYLVSAGWLWHPVDTVRLYDLAAALADPRHLDGKGLGIDAWADDGCSATFLSGGVLAVDLVGLEIEERAPDAPTESLRLFDPSQPDAPRMIRRAERLGTMMSVGKHHLLGLHGHPKLIDLGTGAVERRWPHINSGIQTSSILVNSDSIPPVARDEAGQRCAIADAEGITVLEFFA
jgi:hypothetical protein